MQPRTQARGAGSLLKSTLAGSTPATPTKLAKPSPIFKVVFYQFPKHVIWKWFRKHGGSLPNQVASDVTVCIASPLRPLWAFLEGKRVVALSSLCTNVSFSMQPRNQGTMIINVTMTSDAGSIPASNIPADTSPAAPFNFPNVSPKLPKALLIHLWLCDTKCIVPPLRPLGACLEGFLVCLLTTICIITVAVVPNIVLSGTK